MEDQQLEQIEGTIEDIIFENSDSGYVVFELSGEGKLTVVCGTLGELHVGQSVICRGRYENHATYGRQFHAAECMTDMPKDMDAVYAFLASRSLPYIGPATAQKIIERFGASALDVIANDPGRLTEIKGISADKADRIQQEFKRMFGMRELIAYLAQFEIGPRRAMEVFRAFGPGAAQAIASNPTCCAASRCSWTSATPTASPPITRWKGTALSGWKPPCCAPCATTRATATLPAAGAAGGHRFGFHPPARRQADGGPGTVPGDGAAGGAQLFTGEYIYLPDLLAAEEPLPPG